MRKTIICRACGKEAQISKDGHLVVCKNIECPDNWNKFAEIGSDFFHKNYMEV